MTALVISSSNILAGNYIVVEEMNSSSQIELRIRPVYQSGGNWIHWGANQFYRTNLFYPTISSVENYFSANNYRYKRNKRWLPITWGRIPESR